MPRKKVQPQTAGAPNWANQTIWTGDNLPIMRGMNSSSVDLIYLDPPFNSKTDYAAPIGSKAAGAAFKDTWTLSDVDVEWINLIETKYPALHRVLLAAMTDSDKSYLAYMAVRLLEMKRLLKPTGSIYLHCDSTMSSHLKLVMDAIFHHANFRNEIVWRRATAHNDPKRYGRNTDTILFYAMPGFVWNVPMMAKSEAEMQTAYPVRDERGSYRTGDLTGPKVSMGESGEPWNGYDVSSRGRCWSAPLKGSYAEWIERNAIPGYRAIKSVHARLDALDEANLIHHPQKGRSGWPGLKRYAAADMGSPVQELWTDIPGFTNYNNTKERTGYPTQKPLSLLRRIIEASTNGGDVNEPGDMVLDPFCGCATTCIAAQDTHRKWAGIDISEKAAELVQRRMHDELGLFYDGVHRTDVPRRTDLGKLPAYNSRKNKQELYGKQEGNCTACKQHFEMRNMHIDHIIARSKGGTDHIENLQLLCGGCNSVKGDRGMAYLMARLQLARR